MAALEVAPLTINSTPQVDTVFSRRFTGRRRDPDAMALSVARHTAENGMPIDQVGSYWGVQKGLEFVRKLLDTPVYRHYLSPEEKEHVLRTASLAIKDHFLGAK